MNDSQVDEICRYLKEIAFNLQKLDDDLSGRNNQYKTHAVRHRSNRMFRRSGDTRDL